MTVSEERVNVGKQRRESGRARLRKYVVTEHVTQTVPVRREEVRVEREPITESNRDAALAGPGISEDEHEVVLHEEQPVVEKETVPVERVRLDTETVTDQQTVTRRSAGSGSMSRQIQRAVETTEFALEPASADGPSGQRRADGCAWSSRKSARIVQILRDGAVVIGLWAIRRPKQQGQCPKRERDGCAGSRSGAVRCEVREWV